MPDVLGCNFVVQHYSGSSLAGIEKLFGQFEVGSAVGLSAAYRGEGRLRPYPLQRRLA